MLLFSFSFLLVHQPSFYTFIYLQGSQTEVQRVLWCRLLEHWNAEECGQERKADKGRVQGDNRRYLYGVGVEASAMISLLTAWMVMADFYRMWGETIEIYWNKNKVVRSCVRGYTEQYQQALGKVPDSRKNWLSQDRCDGQIRRWWVALFSNYMTKIKRAKTPSFCICFREKFPEKFCHLFWESLSKILSGYIYQNKRSNS